MNQCIWTWLGNRWFLEESNCPDGSHCDTPTTDGAFAGQVVTTICLPD
jgi:hypothetical protein